MKAIPATWTVPLLCALSVAAQSGASDISFTGITSWTGQGAMRGALVVDWGEDDSHSPLVWGYRFSGQQTSEDMLRAIVADDTRLYVRIGQGGALGVPIYGIGYDRDGDGFELTDGTQFVDGVAISGPSDLATAVDPDDSYMEGWFQGYWAYFTHQGQLCGQGSWSVAATGISQNALSHGGWDGLRFTRGIAEPPGLPNTAATCGITDVHNTAPAAGPAVPEPATGLLLIFCVAIFAERRARVLCAVLIALPCLCSPLAATEYATAVVDYDPGREPAPGFEDPASALGSPTRITGPADPYGGPVTPFQSAFGADEVVSIGFGGSLTLSFDQQVRDRTDHFGTDLLVFGNAFFLDADFPNGVVAGISSEPGLIEVSQDGAHWFPVSAEADTAFPTMGFVDVLEAFPSVAGELPTDFRLPVDPDLDPTGLNMTQLVAAYGGSGGGTGVDIAATGLDWIQYIRISNSNDPGTGITPEVDAVSIVPEPRLAWLLCGGILTVAFRRARR